MKSDIERILVADDDAVIREGLRRILTAEGYEVEAVSNGRTAIERLEQKRFKLLVTELLAHQEEWVREKHHDTHLGFTETQLKDLVKGAGFKHVRVQRAARDPQPPHFMTIVATGQRK